MIRGLSEDLVVSPYATALAALISPDAAIQNFRYLAREGAESRYGFYESIDYTPIRLPPGTSKAVIQAYMAHHQGMIMVAISNLVHADVMQRRFHAEPLVRATELLLQERIPYGTAAWHPRAEEVRSGSVDRQLSGRITRTFDTPNLPTPRADTIKWFVFGDGHQFGRRLFDVRRISRDSMEGRHYPRFLGSFIYLRDVASGKIWSSGFQPLCEPAAFYEVSFSEDKAVIRRRDDKIATTTEIIVSPEDKAEIRRVSITNNSPVLKEIEVTSYSEIVLAPRLADAAHPAFSNLSIETEFNSAETSLIADRRPRAGNGRTCLGRSYGRDRLRNDRCRSL